MSGTATASSVGLHCCHWTRVPALGTHNADGGTLAHLVSLGPLDEEVHALPGPADVSPGRVEPRVKTTVVDSKFPDPQETKEPRGKGCPEHQMVVSFQRGLSPTSAACDPAFSESVAAMWA